MVEDATEEDTEATKREGHPRTSRKEDSYLERGTLVGRYVIIDRLGEGGMGVVYSAFDPELDRKVAVKLLQARPAGGSSGGDQAWLLREAQAMARLQHPNVVAVHDVGTLAGDRVFVAMDLVDGMTLRAWLRQPHTWREALSVMRDAGRGLAAAHQAGLVHRDFKPENVLVAKDGRVFVMDFGLARLEDAPAARTSDLEIAAKSPLTQSMTLVGAVIGTPAYMAPEIYGGHGADGRTDQFAFGVTLYEALYGVRPFDKRQIATKQLAAPKPPHDSAVPATIRKVVLRAIAIDPALRYASLDELLAELEVDPFARRRRGLVVAGVAAVAFASAAAVYVASGNNAQLCRGAERKLAGVWDDTVKRTTAAAFDATKKSFAKQSFENVSRALDAYAAEWIAASTDSCSATRIQGTQTEEILTLRQDCLDQRLYELGALTRLLATAEGNLVDKADAAVFELTPIATCNNVSGLRSMGRVPPDKLVQLKVVQQKLAEARAFVIAGQYGPALTAARMGAADAEKVGWAPMIAEGKLAYAAALSTVGKPTDAFAQASDAVWIAMRAKRDDLVGDAALTCALHASDALGKPAEAKIWLELAKAALARNGTRPHSMHLRELQTEGLVLVLNGDLVGGVAAHGEALELAKQLRPNNSSSLWADEAMYASTLSRSGAYAKAAPHFEHALELREGLVGSDHPDVAILLSNLGSCYRHGNEVAKARAVFERAIAIREKTYGKSSPILVPTLNNLADFLRSHDPKAGLEVIERARNIAKVMPGTSHPLFHTLETTHGELLAALGRTAEARTLLDELLASETKLGSPILGTTLTSRGDLAVATKAYTEAIGFYERAIAVFEATGGKDNPELWKPLTGLARAKAAVGDRSTRPLLERAIAIAEKAQVDASDLEPTRSALAALPK